jgi:hypothetical protein
VAKVQAFRHQSGWQFNSTRFFPPCFCLSYHLTVKKMDLIFRDGTYTHREHLKPWMMSGWWSRSVQQVKDFEHEEKLLARSDNHTAHCVVVVSITRCCVGDLDLLENHKLTILDRGSFAHGNFWWPREPQLVSPGVRHSRQTSLQHSNLPRPLCYLTPLWAHGSYFWGSGTDWETQQFIIEYRSNLPAICQCFY